MTGHKWACRIRITTTEEHVRYRTVADVITNDLLEFDVYTLHLTIQWLVVQRIHIPMKFLLHLSTFVVCGQQREKPMRMRLAARTHTNIKQQQQTKHTNLLYLIP